LAGHKDSFTDLERAVEIRVQRLIYDAKNGSTLPGTAARKEGDPPTGDKAVDNVYDSLGTVYEFFWFNYERDSIDNQGMELRATVHYQKGYDAAFWDGSQLVFGDGDEDLPVDQRLFNNFTNSISVLAQEYVYGIVQYETGLAYTEKSGALAASYGDIFGSLIKQYQHHQTAAEADWIVGEDLFAPNVQGIGLRSLKAPGTAYDDPVLGKDPQPGHMRDYVNTVSDNGGVHINSGIPNHAFYLIAIKMGGYAWEKAGRIWYVTLRDKLQPDSNFQDAANKTFQVAGELYGKGSAEQEAVREGWSEVGITVTTPGG
jgi:Zn-dependent metalloprotease